MAGLLDTLPASDRVREVARQHLVETSVYEVIFWRPWMYDRVAIDGLEHLDQALAHGRGVVLVSAHIGPFSIRPLLARGYRAHVVDGGGVGEPYVGSRGLRKLERNNRVEDAGGKVISPPDAFAKCQAVLESGEICAISFDLPGEHETRFGNRDVRVRTGVARLALATGAPLVPGFASRHGHRLTGRLDEPIDPHAFASLDELIAHLASVVSAEMIARPAECDRTAFAKRLSVTGPPPN